MRSDAEEFVTGSFRLPSNPRVPLSVRPATWPSQGEHWVRAVYWSYPYITPQRATTESPARWRHTNVLAVKITLDPVAARAEHQRAVQEFLTAARAVPADRWERAPDDAHWSPSQIAEHVRMTYAVVGAQFAGGPGLRVRTSWLMRVVLRWKFLKGILENGAFPKGARAPKEIRPGQGPFDRETVLTALQQAAAETEQRLIARWSDPSCQMTHHVFGALHPPQGARLVTVHTRHHARQLAALASD